MQKMAEAFKILISKGLEKITFPKISLKKKLPAFQVEAGSKFSAVRTFPPAEETAWSSWCGKWWSLVLDVRSRYQFTTLPVSVGTGTLCPADWVLL